MTEWKARLEQKGKRAKEKRTYTFLEEEYAKNLA
jgi:hypothetical protein